MIRPLTLVAATLVSLAGVESDILAEAWAAGRQTEIRLLAAAAAPGTEARIWLARSTLGGSAEEGLGHLEGSWPQDLRGFRAQVMAELLMETAAPARLCREHLFCALEWGGPRVEVDRCLAMLVDVYDGEGAHEQAGRCAQVLWGAWPSSPWRAAAGLYLAEAPGVLDPAAAEQVLHAVLVAAHATAAQRRQAREGLCRLLIDGRPAAVLALTEGHEGQPWQAWRLRARWSLGEVGLDEHLRAVPAVVARRVGIDRLLSVAEPASRVALRQAVQARGAGDLALAERLLRPYLSTDSGCLQAWLSLPGIRWESLRLVDCGADGSVVLQVAAVMVTEHRQAALALLAEAGVGLSALDPSLADVLAAWLRLLPEHAGAERAKVEQRLQACRVVHAAVGESWCRRAQATDGDDAMIAWEEAARWLPAAHPWLPGVAARVMTWRWRSWQESGRDDDLAALVDIGERVPWTGAGSEVLRCRFLLASAAVERGEGERASVLISGLRPHADSRQRRLLDALQQRLLEGGRIGPRAQAERL